MTKTSVKSVCPYCGVGCGIIMDVVDNQVVKVIGDTEHPANRGRLCTKGQTCGQAIANAGRMNHAYLRHDRRHEPVRCGLDSAIQETAQRLRAIIDQHGPDAFAFYVSGQMSIEAQYLANKLAKGFIGTNNIESNSRLCMASAGSGYKQSLGSDAPPGSYEDMDQTDLFFVIGANMADCHPILFLRMMDRVKAGAKLIVVDPRRTTTADKATLYLPIAPGTDLALLNGLLHLLVKNGDTDPEFISRYTEGWEAMPDFLEHYPPAHVAAITGLKEEDIRTAAAWIGGSRRWMSCWTMGLNQSSHGTWNTNSLCNLHLATGAICRPGAGPFSLTGQPNAMGGREMGYMGPGLPGQRSVLVASDRDFMEKVWGIPQGSLHPRGGGGTVALFEDMGAGKIKACWIICTNPVASVPNRAKVIAGLEAAELVITQDAFLDTETNRYADILLPGALWAEAEGVMVNSERNLTLMQKAVEPEGDTLADWQIIAKVACAMGYQEAFSYHSAADVFAEITLCSNEKTGYELRGISHERLRQQPIQWPCPKGGQSRNPIRYIVEDVSDDQDIMAAHRTPTLRFATDTGKAQFLPRPHLDPVDLPDDEFGLVLNTGRVQHQWHTLTKTGKIPTLNKLNPGPFVEIHPDDATVRGIQDGDQVEIRSRRGKAILPAVVTNRVRPGNCFAPFHWNDVFGENLAINALTSDAVDPISLEPEFKFAAVALTLVSRATPASAPDTNTHTPGTGMDRIDPSTLASLSTILGLNRPPSPTLSPDEQTYLQGFLAGLGHPQALPGVPALPTNAPLDPANSQYINGLLAGLFSRTPISTDQPDNGCMTVLWASQTGNAENFAHYCAKYLRSQGHTLRIAPMDEFSVARVADSDTVLFITSTFGDGDPPDNAAQFWQALSQESAPQLSKTRFCVLAFGDSNYDQFCGFGRKLDARLEALGASRILPRMECEPEFETTAKAWLKSLSEHITSQASQGVFAWAGDDEEEVETTPGYHRNQPLRCPLVINRRLNGPGAEKDTRQFAFDLGDSGLHYEAGDALGVWPRNCPELASTLLTTLGLEAQDDVSIPDHGDSSLIQALIRHYDITRITPEFLQFVLSRNRNPELANLLDPNHKEALKQWCWGRQLIDVLETYPLTLTSTELLSVLKRLQPRLYSIASSAKETPRQVHLTVSAVRYGRQHPGRKGVASTFLADRAGDEPVPIFVQRSAHFRVPRNPDTPMIMVGPGTGVAPFRAFLQERRATGARGKNWLFFGEQRAATDFYYRDELETLQRQGYLHRLDTAFSRDQAAKVYVQDRMRENGAELWAWLQEGAHFYICGDASRMAKDVDNTLKAVIAQYGQMSETAATDYVAAMTRDKRYLRDVY